MIWAATPLACGFAGRLDKISRLDQRSLNVR